MIFQLKVNSFESWVVLPKERVSDSDLIRKWIWHSNWMLGIQSLNIFREDFYRKLLLHNNCVNDKWYQIYYLCIYNSKNKTNICFTRIAIISWWHLYVSFHLANVRMLVRWYPLMNFFLVLWLDNCFEAFYFNYFIQYFVH